VSTGENDKLMQLLLEGYDHILDVEDEENNHIFDVVQRRNEQETLAFLQSVPSFEVIILFVCKESQFDVVVNSVFNLEDKKVLVLNNSSQDLVQRRGNMLHVAIFIPNFKKSNNEHMNIFKEN
jgi:hypothetical protein